MEHTGLPFGLFRFFKHEQSSYFCRALTIFAGALPPWAPPWWRGRAISRVHTSTKADNHLMFASYWNPKVGSTRKLKRFFSSVIHNATRFHENRLKTFCVILFTHKQSDRHWRKYNLFGAGCKLIDVDFLARDAFVIERIVALWCSSVCPSVCLSGTGVHCGHLGHISADLSLWLDSPM